MDAASDVAERYARFARDEAPGRSALYLDWSSGIATDAELCTLLAAIPATHRQPPLVFAVTRMLGAPEGPYDEWAQWVRANRGSVVEECSRRSLQTNEPLRCAALLPALADVAGPIALLEIGASAGLCLYPDRYSYRYAGGPDLDPADGVSSVVLQSAYCAGAYRNGAHQSGPEQQGPLWRLPEVVWRAGVDIAPLDAADPADRRFLTSLVWPGEYGRVERITAALDLVARRRADGDSPHFVAADAADPGVLEDLVTLAPSGVTVVVTLPGVIAHIPRAGRARLFETLAALGVAWISIDPPGMREHWAPSVDVQAWRGWALVRNGVPLAEVDPLGAFVEWRAGVEPARG